MVAVGAHPDDIELGCGGTLLRHVAAGDDVTMLVMTRGEAGPQGERSRVEEQERAADVLGARLLWGPYRDNHVPSGREVVGLLDDVLRSTGAETVYVHAPHDTHQDHVAASAAVLAAARRSTRVLRYQSPSTSAFHPSVFVDVEDTLAGKLLALEAHRSQVDLCPMVDLEAIAAGCRYWGSQARVHYAEAFEAPRFLWDIRPSIRAYDALPAGSAAV